MFRSPINKLTPFLYHFFRKNKVPRHPIYGFSVININISLTNTCDYLRNYKSTLSNVFSYFAYKLQPLKQIVICFPLQTFSPVFPLGERRFPLTLLWEEARSWLRYERSSSLVLCTPTACLSTNTLRCHNTLFRFRKRVQ